MIYLDHAATTSVCPRAVAEMKKCLEIYYGNPSGAYEFAQQCKEKIETARKQVAKSINASKDEIYFTSGGTESDNWALFGTVRACRYKGKRGRHIITSCIEHHAILNSCKALEKQGYRVTYLPVDERGVISLRDLERAIRNDTILISIMYANNEIGTIQPIDEIAKIAKKYNIYFHTDAVQAVGHLEVDVKALGVDMLSASAHKFNGPKGVGFLYIKKGTSISPLINGGSQESGHRAGTENVAYIAGMAVALDENIEKLNENQLKIKELRKRLISQLRVLSFSINGSENGIDNILSLSFPNQSGEAMLHKLDLLGVMISTGSACDSKETQVSHVIKAIHLPDDLAEGTIRISLSSDNTLDEMDTIAEKIKRCCNL